MITVLPASPSDLEMPFLGSGELIFSRLRVAAVSHNLKGGYPRLTVQIDVASFLGHAQHPYLLWRTVHAV